MEYETETTESGIKIIDKRKVIKKPKRGFGQLFKEVFIFLLGIFTVIISILTIGWLIVSFLGEMNAEIVALLDWFWSFNVYMQLVISALIALLGLSLSVSIVIFFGYEDE